MSENNQKKVLSKISSILPYNKNHPKDSDTQFQRNKRGVTERTGGSNHSTWTSNRSYYDRRLINGDKLVLLPISVE